MDDRRFDAIAKSLAEGKSRRSVLKGILGLGGAALAGSVLLDGDSEAARRPTNPTPTPVRCPGSQTPVGGQCQCLVPPAPGPNKCGPDCCNSNVLIGPGYSECCDQACCYYPNDCVGEELCCPRLPDIGCLDARGGCCATLCEETPGFPVCCPVEDFCPGGSESEDLCCTGNETCCGRGTNANACVDLTVEGNCCNDADCGSEPCITCHLDTHTCGPLCDEATQVCCTDQAGPGVCQDGTCCPAEPCRLEGQLCCVNSAGISSCVTTGECCTLDADCNNGCLACVGGACIGQCTRPECCTVAPDRADWFCMEPGQCCTSEDCDNPPDLCSEGVCGPAHNCRYIGCGDGFKCCGPDTDLCVPDDAICCTPPPQLDGVTPAVVVVPLLCPECMTCNGEGFCVPVIDGLDCVVPSDDDDADNGICCSGVCIENANCCISDDCGEGETCCADVNVCGPSCNGGLCCPGGFCDGSGNCCLPPSVGCNGGVCCDTFCDINGECCASGIGCNGGVCCDVACDVNGDCPPPPCVPNCACGDGVVDPATDGLACNGGLDAGGGVCACGWCAVPLDGCPCGCAGDTECVRCNVALGECETYNQGGGCGDSGGICEGEWCVLPPPCEPNCACSDADGNAINDGLACNGGGGGAACGCGYCVFPIPGCPCGCEGDEECIRCSNPVDGVCELYNQLGICNGGAGFCSDQYCFDCLGLTGACSVDTMCCSGLCSDAGSCVDCKDNGDSCDSAGDCCSDNCAGTCFAP